MWQPGWEGGLGENGYMYMYGCIPSLFIWNYHNTVDWLYPNKILKVQKKKRKIVCEEAAEGRDMGRDHQGITHHPQELSSFFRETVWGSEEEAEQAPSPFPDSVGKAALCRLHSTLGQTRNHSPECKPPILQDVGNLEQEIAVTHTLTSLSLTPCSLGWGMERLQNMETVLLAQVCAKPLTPDDHRSGEGILQVNIFKRNPLFPRRLCSPNIMYFNVHPSGLQKAVITVQMLGFCKAKSLTDTVMVSSGVSLAGPVSSDSTKHSSRCCCEGILWMWFTSIIRTSGEETTLNIGGFIQSDKGPKSKTWGFLEEEEILSQDSRVSSCLRFQPAGLPFWFQIHQARPTAAWAKSLR